MKRGSITLYLCLILCVLLSLISAAFYSARISAGRVVLASGLEQGLYSLFGEYDRQLYERFGLLLIDGGRGSASLQLHRLTETTETYASYILNPAKNRPLSGSLLAMERPAASITAYSLATDGNGAAFARQVCTAMKGRLAANGLRRLTEELGDAAGLMQRQREQMPARASDTGVSAQEQAAADAIELDEAYDDPRKTVAEARRTGLLRLVLPAGAGVSGYAAAPSELPSGRSLQRGIGGAVQQSGGVVDHALLAEYAAELFTSYTSAQTGAGGGLQYQQEYLICGKHSDEENLKGVLNRLMVIREASNLAYLASSPQRRAESLAAATVICGAIGVPYLAPVAAAGIRTAWAYAEGILDLRGLLSGGKVPLIKTDTSWQLSIAHLPQFLAHVDSDRQSDAGGLTYDQYLRTLLLVKSDQDLTSGLMDLVEHTMREQEHADTFRIDNCIDAISMELAAVVEGRQIRTEGAYGYGRT